MEDNNVSTLTTGRIFFYVPDTKNQISSTIWEIYYMANVLKRTHEVSFIVSEDNFEHPDFVEKELHGIDVFTPKRQEELGITEYDLIIVPEFFVNVLELIKNVKCKIFVLFSSRDTFLRRFNTSPHLASIYQYSSYFGVDGVIFNNQTNYQFFIDNYPIDAQNLILKVLPINIPKYFKSDDVKSSLKIGVYGKNISDINHFIEVFYSRYPQYRFVSFEWVSGTTEKPKLERASFAESLKTYPISVWIDRSSSSYYFPIECLLAKTIPICLIPEHHNEFLYEDGMEGIFRGLWFDKVISYRQKFKVDDKEVVKFNDMVEGLSIAIAQFLEDNLNDEIMSNAQKTVEKYLVSSEKEQEIIETFKTIIGL